MVAGPSQVAAVAAELVVNRLRARPAARFALPTGRTPEGMYARLRELASARRVDATRATAFQLDEYAGIGPADARSFAATLRRELDGVGFGSLRTLDGAGPDALERLAAHERAVEAMPLDLAVLGLGRDGHVAFDEPGSTLTTGARRVRLHPLTRADAADAFGGEPPAEALTLGLRTLAAARELLVLVTGAAKAEVLRAALEGAPGPGCPASLLRDHPRLTVVCDAAAAARLARTPGRSSRRVLIVLGHRDPGFDVEHRASAESFARVRRAERVARRTPPRAVIFTGFTSTGGRTEAEQMAGAWPRGLAPVLLEHAGRRTAENASCSYPLIAAMGGIEQVVVVTSAWHLRAPYFFAPLRRRGLDVRYARSGPRRGWARLLRRELVEAPHARRERRSAWAAPGRG